MVSGRPALQPLLLFLLILLISPLVWADGDSERIKVVFHINNDDPEHQHGALRNLDNHIAAVGAEHLDLKVVLQGGGVSLLVLPEALPHLPAVRRANAGPDFRQRIDKLRSQGVAFLVSGRTLAEHGIDFRRDLYGVGPEQVVPNALSHLSRLQRQGYAYIKP